MCRQLINDFAIEWDTELLEKKSCVFVAGGCGVDGDVQTLSIHVSAVQTAKT